jgi:hypothetical protein
MWQIALSNPAELVGLRRIPIDTVICQTRYLDNLEGITPYKLLSRYNFRFDKLES